MKLLVESMHILELGCFIEKKEKLDLYNYLQQLLPER